MNRTSYRKPNLVFHGYVESLTKAQASGGPTDCDYPGGSTLGSDTTDNSDFFFDAGTCNPTN